MLHYIICYPKGDKSRISIAQGDDCDVYDYCLASRKLYDEDQLEEAKEYAKELAKNNGLKYEGYNDDDGNDYLD